MSEGADGLTFAASLSWLDPVTGVPPEALRVRAVLWVFFDPREVMVEEAVGVLERLLRRFRTRAFAAVLVAVGRDEEERDRSRAMDLIRMLRPGVPLAFDAGGAAAGTLGVGETPAWVVTSPDGTASTPSADWSEGDAVVAAVERALAAVPAPAENMLSVPTGLDAPSGFLAFPMGLWAEGQFLCVANTGRHSVVIFDRRGTVRQVIGCGEPAWEDGYQSEARFRLPRGVLFSEGILIIADTGNHCVRAMDTAVGVVRTVAGTGRPARPAGPAGPGHRAGLAFPWGLAVSGGTIWITLAGAHQVWALDPGRVRLEPVAGKGERGSADGPGPSAQFDQPAGMCVAGEIAYVCDSLGRRIRSIEPQRRMGVSTRRWRGEPLRFPVAICANGGKLFVADAGADAVFEYDPRSDDARRIPLEPGVLSGPSGVCVWQDALVVADTRHHRLLRVDPVNGSHEEIRIRV